MYFHTIVAPITGTPAPVAIVRLSGPESWSIASRLFSPWPNQPKSHRAVYGHLATGDDGLALPFSEGHSYTGDEAVEISLHGALASVRKLLELCIEHGARMAEPGEFTQRAFLNGRIDLTQAEGVRDTIEAQTDAQLRQASLHREGVLHRRISSMREQVLGLLVSVEASVDFSEEIGDFDRSGGLSTVEGLTVEIDKLLSTLPAGRVLRNGLRIAIVGPPNVGKSSLLNALLGSDRAIVTDIPGTTRDYVEEQIDLGGVVCTLIDTAGLRETQDVVEALGVQRTRTIAANADEVWYVYDATIGLNEADCEWIDSSPRTVTVLANKSDLRRGSRGLPISALTREGLAELIRIVAIRIECADSAPFINLRHEQPLSAARQALDSVRAAIENDLPDDLLSVGLRDAAEQLGAITGETATPDVIERIFHDFCIGK